MRELLPKLAKQVKEYVVSTNARNEDLMLSELALKTFEGLEGTRMLQRHRIRRAERPCVRAGRVQDLEAKTKDNTEEIANCKGQIADHGEKIDHLEHGVKKNRLNAKRTALMTMGHGEQIHILEDKQNNFEELMKGLGEQSTSWETRMETMESWRGSATTQFSVSHDIVQKLRAELDEIAEKVESLPRELVTQIKRVNAHNIEKAADLDKRISDIMR